MPEIQKPEDKSGKLCMCKVNLGLGLFTSILLLSLRFFKKQRLKIYCNFWVKTGQVLRTSDTVIS